MEPLGIITGTVPLPDKKPFTGLEPDTVKTAFGTARVFRAESLVLILRHGADAGLHILPHLINHRANLQAMRELGVREVLGIHSTGSLKRRLRPGVLVVPDDYLMPTPGPTTVSDRAVHIVPALSDEMRQRWLDAAADCGQPVIDGGAYWQTAGPRLETRAEVAMMSRFADLVGMTMASEAIIAQELGLAFASLCSVDNFAHGIGAKALTLAEIRRHAAENATSITRILESCLSGHPGGLRPEKVQQPG
jgi:5'-methylthioadenosine phosphorylase